jgi:TolB-like protein/DNA-binding winged helix-turn-helix (wHTH) protein/Tfp pilus assembly protein PilF
MKPEHTSGPVRFGVFQADPRTGELYKHGIRLRLQEQPFQLLLLLLERPGEVVSREELRQKLWASTTHVDFDHCLNIAMNKLRDALGESAENPRYIETLPKRGYRFIGTVERPGAAAAAATRAEAEASIAPASGEPAASGTTVVIGRRELAWILGAAAVLLVFMAAMWTMWLGREPGMARPAAGGGSGGGRLMLAVLPFENLSNDPQQEYFIAGLTDELIAQLGRMHAARLGVIARTSVLQYAGTRKPIQEIGRELNVGYVLEGSVRRSGERVRITAQLIAVTDQTHLWAETFDRQAQDVLQVQSEVAKEVADALGMELLPGERAAMERMPTESMAAYDEYLRGRHFWNRRTEADFEKARAHFERAIAKDPGFALAHAALADTYNLMGGYAMRPAGDVFPKAKAAARKAMELDGTLGAPHAALGFAAFNYDWDFQAAEQHFREALARNPNNAAARQWYAELLHAWGRVEEAQAEIRRARELDPLSMAVMDDAGWILVSRKKLDEAVQEFQSEVELNEQWPYACYSLATAYMYSGKHEQALQTLERARAVGGETARYLQVRAMVEAFAGRKQQALQTLAKLMARPEGERGPVYGQAAVYAGLGDAEAALALLEKGYAMRESWLVWLRTYPEWEPLRGDARFQELVKRMGLPAAR